MSNLPSVSIIIPCRNEEKYIRECLNSIIASEYNKDKLEILVADGLSDDETRDIIKEYSQRYSFVKLLDNPKKIVPTALNIGIRAARGEVIIRMDAHTMYEKDYILKCVKYLKEYDVENVGGVVITLPSSDKAIAKSIAHALSHPFGVGNSYFRIGADKPIFVDTVPFGCFKREVFEKVGLFNEFLVRNQDDEFNSRIIKSGGKVLLVPEIVSHYYARDSISTLWRMYFQYGYFKPLVASNVGAVLTLRQLMPSFFILSLIVSGVGSLMFSPLKWLFLLIISLYLLCILTFSLSISIKRDFKCILTLPLVFSVLHISYGLGYFKGILDFLVFKKHKKMEVESVPLSR
jgi:cellulose synthase/poly-beta-1,6-N-acetylglucosamine synthase-like glycosyltransferase